MKLLLQLRVGTCIIIYIYIYIYIYIPDERNIPEVEMKTIKMRVIFIIHVGERVINLKCRCHPPNAGELEGIHSIRKFRYMQASSKSMWVADDPQ